MAILFASDNLRVAAVDTFKSKILVVSFSERDGAGQSIDRPGFGQSFLRKLAVDGIFVTCRGNDWYQYPEMSRAIETIKSRIREGVSVVTYGSSMGGYAAIRFASALSAARVIALSPQYSICSRLAPFERRWPQDASRIAFDADEAKIDVEPSTETYIFADPFDGDGKHADLIKNCISHAVVFKAPFAGHPVGHFLREAEILTDVISRLISGSFPSADWPKIRREGRVRSNLYLDHLSTYLKARNKARLVRPLEQCAANAA